MAVEDESPECQECGRNDVVGQVGSFFYCSRHGDKVAERYRQGLDADWD